MARTATTRKALAQKIRNRLFEYRRFYAFELDDQQPTTEIALAVREMLDLARLQGLSESFVQEIVMATYKDLTHLNQIVKANDATR